MSTEPSTPSPKKATPLGLSLPASPMHSNPSTLVTPPTPSPSKTHMAEDTTVIMEDPEVADDDDEAGHQSSLAEEEDDEAEKYIKDPSTLVEDPIKRRTYAERIRNLSGLRSGAGASLAKFKWPCGLTNFHLSLIIGIFGFFVFWLALLLRIYLPDKYWL